VKNIRLYLSLDTSIKLLYLEAYLLLGWARVLKCVPFSILSHTLGEEMAETSFDDNESDQKVKRQISQAIHLMSRYTFWESKCLVKAIAGLKMLERRKIESTLYLGTARDISGKMIAHAWLRSGNKFITGSEEMERFTVVGKFAKKWYKNTKGVNNE
jgi:hypothetical protein